MSMERVDPEQCSHNGRHRVLLEGIDCAFEKLDDRVADRIGPARVGELRLREGAKNWDLA